MYRIKVILIFISNPEKTIYRQIKNVFKVKITNYILDLSCELVRII